MFAVVRTGGKQYRVAAGDKIAVEKLAGEAGDKITLGDIVLAGEAGEIKDAAGVVVSAEIIAQASRDRLVAEFLSTTNGSDLPWQLRGADIGEQPIRRAISNPIWLG